MGGGEAKKQPVGVWDSGVGGLTVLREMRRALPDETFVYIGDGFHAPYGGRTPAEITDFSFALSHFLVNRHNIRALVVACNTATAASAPALRDVFTPLGIPVVAMEPAVKPAVLATKTGKVGVLATVGTLKSARFAALLARYEGGSVQFITQPCPGLVEAVETGQTRTPETRALLSGYIAPLLAQNVDTIVLGCTHYPVLRSLIAEIAGPDIVLIDTGEAVARRLHTVLGETGLWANKGNGAGGLECYTTGDVPAFIRAAQTILKIPNPSARCLQWTKGELTDADTANSNNQHK